MPEIDVSQRFTVENEGARGELVRLEKSFQTATACIDYPENLKTLLGEALSAVTLLSATIKFAGKLSLQLQGEGPMTLLLVQATHDRNLRGLIHWQGSVQDLTFAQLTTESQLAITIEPDEGTRYQGIVPLEGDCLGDCLEHYFQQSEQLPTKIRLVSAGDKAAGLLLQKLPGHDNQPLNVNWDHLAILAQSVTAEELLTIDFETILYRLFHAEQVRVFSQKPVRFQCACSKERCKNAVLSLGKGEVEKIVADRKPIAMNCEFCGAVYHLNESDLKKLLYTFD